MRDRTTPLVVLGAIPWILLAVSTNWIFSDTGVIDPWLYHGYFHRYPDFVSHLFPHAYYGTRLPWILPGYAAYHLLPAYGANFTLHLLFLYVSIATLYRVTSRLTTRPAALIAAAAFATSAPAVAAFGWDYVDISVITYTLITLWAIVEASVSRRRSTLLLIAGAAAACVVHSNLVAILEVPAFLICYWFFHTKSRWRDVVLLMGGGVTATLVLGLVNLLVGGEFLFFMPSVRWALASTHAESFVPVQAMHWPGSSRFLIPLVGVCAATGAFVKRRTGAAWVTLLMAGWLFLAFLAFDLLLDGGLLQIQYYVSWFLPLTAIGVAAATDGANLSLTTAARIALGIAALQAAALANIPATLHLQNVLRAVGSPPIVPIELMLLAVTLTIIGVCAARASGPRHIGGLAVAAVVVNAIVTSNLGYTASPSSRSQFDAVQQTLAFIGAHVPNNTRPRFWIPSNSPQSTFYDSIASTHLYLASLVSLTYPHLTDNTANAPKGGSDLEPGDYLVIASDTKPAPQAIAEELRRVRLGSDLVAWAPVRTQKASFILTLLHITE